MPVFIRLLILPFVPFADFSSTVEPSYVYTLKCLIVIDRTRCRADLPAAPISLCAGELSTVGRKTVLPAVLPRSRLYCIDAYGEKL